MHHGNGGGVLRDCGDPTGHGKGEKCVFHGSGLRSKRVEVAKVENGTSGKENVRSHLLQYHGLHPYHFGFGETVRADVPFPGGVYNDGGVAHQRAFHVHR